MNSENNTIIKFISPVIVPVSENETEEQFLDRWTKFDKLEENTKKKISSEETIKKIQLIGKHYDLELIQIASIARFIRNYYFGDVSLENFSKILIEEAKINPDDAEEISKIVTAKIINDTSFNEQAPKKTTEMIPIIEALEKYPKIGNQLITSSPIKIKPVSDPSQPTIKNWIFDYHSNLGVGHHEIIEQGNYLFHSKNTKRLSSADRDRLTEIIKSLEEKTPLKIDFSLQKVVFETEKEKATTETPPREDQAKKIIETLAAHSKSQQNTNSKNENNAPISKKETGIQNGSFSIGKKNASDNISTSQNSKQSMKEDFSRGSLSEKHTTQQQAYSKNETNQEKGSWFLGEENKDKIFRSNFDEDTFGGNDDSKKTNPFRISPMGKRNSQKNSTFSDNAKSMNVVDLKNQ